jgi:hypothetical protein
MLEYAVFDSSAATNASKSPAVTFCCYRLDAAGRNRARNGSSWLRAYRSPLRAGVRCGILTQPNEDVAGYMHLPKMDMGHCRRRSQVRISELVGSCVIALVEIQLKFALAISQDRS